jgi:hypothetical protein
MNVFTIDTENNITVHASRKAARETGTSVFESAETLAEVIGPDGKRLVEIWNSLTGVTPVKKFTNRAIGAKRIYAELQKLGPASSGATDETRAKVTSGRQASVSRVAKKGASESEDEVIGEPRAGGKKETVLNLISRKDGASLAELMTALNWQKHSVRGFIATLGKTVNSESFKTDQGARSYKTV